jgi:hypothetical protein
LISGTAAARWRQAKAAKKITPAAIARLPELVRPGSRNQGGLLLAQVQRGPRPFKTAVDTLLALAATW